MKIAVFSRSTIEHFKSGGMETQLKILVEGLAESGHEVEVITTANPSSLEKDQYKEVNNVGYHYIGSTTPGLNPLTLWEKIFSLLRLLNRGNFSEGSKNYFIESLRIFNEINQKKTFDLIISQSTGALGVYENTKLPIISVIHGSIKSEIKNRLKANKNIKNWIRFLGIDLPKWYFELYTSNKKFFNHVNKIVAVSNKLKQNFLIDHPNLGSKVEVIYNGVDSDVFSLGTEKLPDFTLLYIGRMDREKGVDLILQIVNELRKKNINVKANLIGTGVHLEEFKNLASSLKINENVIFLGQIPNADLPKYYRESHIFLFPTRREEGHPMTLSEAFCSGLPVIASDIGGLSESIENGKNGFLVKVGDVKEFVKLIEMLYQNPNKLKAMSFAAREKGLQDFSKSSMIQKYVKLIKDL